jgi:hypothetical protein
VEQAARLYLATNLLDLGQLDAALRKAPENGNSLADSG